MNTLSSCQKKSSESSIDFFMPDGLNKFIYTDIFKIKFELRRFKTILIIERIIKEKSCDEAR